MLVTHIAGKRGSSSLHVDVRRRPLPPGFPPLSQRKKKEHNKRRYEEREEEGSLGEGRKGW